MHDRLRETDGRPSGFDYMRLGLALAVVGFHSCVTSYGFAVQDEIWATLWRVPLAAILPMFFALSGFLVFGSLERCRTILRFLGLRVLRIIPALTVEVLLSAFLLGPLLTALPLRDYFADPQFKSYLLNVFGDVHYRLPGLFADNPQPFIVNGQLWTVPWELGCYIALTGLAVMGIAKRRHWLLYAIAGLYVAYVGVAIMRPHVSAGPVPANSLILTFLAGGLIYKYRDRLPWNVGWFAASAALAALLLAVPNGDRFIALPLAYATAYLGLLNPPRHRVLLSGDYSYGIFLYGYPLQQAFASLGPWAHHWYLNLLCVVPAVSLFAAFSWWRIEQPALSLRTRLKQFEDFSLAYRASAFSAFALWLGRRRQQFNRGAASDTSGIAG